MFQFLFIFEKSDKGISYGPKTVKNIDFDKFFKKCNVNHFQQLLIHTFPPSMKFIFHFSTDTAYFILQVASLSAKF